MRVAVRGSNSILTPREQRYMVHWVMRQMMGRQAEKLDIQIHNVKDLIYVEKKTIWNERAGSWEIRTKRYTAKGDCIWMDRHHKPNRFRIRIKNWVNRPTQRKIILHECRHVFQWATGMMKDYQTELSPIYIPLGRGNWQYARPSMIRWKNSRYIDELVEYDDQPWEKDAQRWEGILIEKYKEHLSREGLSF